MGQSGGGDAKATCRYLLLGLMVTVRYSTQHSTHIQNYKLGEAESPGCCVETLGLRASARAAGWKAGCLSRCGWGDVTGPGGGLPPSFPFQMLE